MLKRCWNAICANIDQFNLPSNRRYRSIPHGIGPRVYPKYNPICRCITHWSSKVEKFQVSIRVSSQVVRSHEVSIFNKAIVLISTANRPFHDVGKLITQSDALKTFNPLWTSLSAHTKSWVSLQLSVIKPDTNSPSTRHSIFATEFFHKNLWFPFIDLSNFYRLINTFTWKLTFFDKINHTYW